MWPGSPDLCLRCHSLLSRWTKKAASNMDSHTGTLLGPHSEVRQCLVCPSSCSRLGVSSACGCFYYMMWCVSRSVFIRAVPQGAKLGAVQFHWAWRSAGRGGRDPLWTRTWRRASSSLRCHRSSSFPAKLLKFRNVLCLSFVISENRNSLLWTRTGLRLILFQGCDAEATSEFALLSQIWERLRTVT